MAAGRPAFPSMSAVNANPLPFPRFGGFPQAQEMTMSKNRLPYATTFHRDGTVTGWFRVVEKIPCLKAWGK